MNKEAVDAVARAIAKAEGYDWYSIKGGQLLHDRFYVRARAAIAAARPHVLEEAAQIAETATPDDDSMDMQVKRQAAAAIRAAKEGE